MPDAAYTVPTSAVVVSRSATWRYLDGGVAPAGDWTGVDDDDAAWAAGRAPLGYDRSRVSHRFATVVSTGATAARPDDAAITTWFRHRFAIEDARGARRLVARLERDDGAVIYLNGVEVARSGMPDVPIRPETLALRELRANDVVTLDLPTCALRDGGNCLAVEVHQRSATSSDIVFALELRVER